jgi:PAS domain S-box-containing protein/putative nucleotidyltransferase with HDIG domain
MNNPKKEKILVFSKDIEFLTSLCEILSKVGYMVSGSTLWEHTLEAMKNQSVDLILTDAAMPDMDGIALMRAALVIDPHLARIIITGQDTVQTSAGTSEVVDSDYVIKPFKAEELLMKISRAMEVRRLKKSEEIYRAIFENSVEGIYLTSSEGQFIAANKPLARILGYESPKDLMTDLKNNCDQIYIEPKRRSKFMNLVKKTEVISGFESQVYHKDGSKIWISESLRAVRDTNGNLIYYRGAIHDITIRKKEEMVLNESIKQLQLRTDKTEQNKYLFLDIIDEISDSYYKTEELFNNFVRAIVNAIDEKRPWMRGHSERVASYSIKIAKAMGLSEEEMEKIRLAALLHDIGQIIINNGLIDKPANLTDKELELIRKIPVQGVSIIKRVKQLSDIIPLIRHHHERIDGKGYPDGLKGEEIPVGARILHVADSFDSMTADRPHRQAPGKEYAFLEFKRCINTQFDPRVTELALKVL